MTTQDILCGVRTLEEKPYHPGGEREMEIAALLLALVLGIRHGMAPDHLAAVGTLVEKTRVSFYRSVGIALRIGVGHGVGMSGIIVLILVFSWQLPPRWDLWTNWASGLWLIIIAFWLLLDLVRELRRMRVSLGNHLAEDGYSKRVVGYLAQGRYGKWLQQSWAAWAVGLMLGIAVSPGDLAIYTLVIQHGKEPIAALVLFGVFLGGMLASITLVGAGLGWSNARQRLRQTLQAISGLAGMGVGFALISGILH